MPPRPAPSFFPEYFALAANQSDHDPLLRQEPDEPRFVLLARDWSAAELVRIWVALRRRDPHLLDMIVTRLKRAMIKREYHPRDAEHVLSAQRVSNSMDLWAHERRGKPIEAHEIEGAPV